MYYKVENDIKVLVIQIIVHMSFRNNAAQGYIYIVHLDHPTQTPSVEIRKKDACLMRFTLFIMQLSPFSFPLLHLYQASLTPKQHPPNYHIFLHHIYPCNNNFQQRRPLLTVRFDRRWTGRRRFCRLRFLRPAGPVPRSPPPDPRSPAVQQSAWNRLFIVVVYYITIEFWPMLTG